MTGDINLLLKYAGLALLTLLALFGDIRTYKVKNSVVLPFIIFGVALNTLNSGVEGAVSSISGILLPVLLLFVFFALRMMGAGDIKFFCAAGAITGPFFVLNLIAYSFVCGGIICIIIMAVRKNGLQRLLYLGAYLKSCFLTMSLLPYSDFSDKNSGERFQFMYAIACGLIVSITVDAIV